jgi:hypothetical protein
MHDWERVEQLAWAAFHADDRAADGTDYQLGFRTGHASACAGCKAEPRWVGTSGRRKRSDDVTVPDRGERVNDV